MPYSNPDKQRQYQLDWMLRRRQKWIAENGPCFKCGSTFDLEVDHVDRSTKINHRVWSWSAARRLAELAKCQVLCATCHLAKTTEENSSAEIPHGSHSGYSRHGCRCGRCRTAHATYERERRRRIA